ncbi:MAG: signal peptidase I [bacterium]|nr:signal peptidase I [bacterium]
MPDEPRQAAKKNNSEAGMSVKCSRLTPYLTPDPIPHWPIREAIYDEQDDQQRTIFSGSGRASTEGLVGKVMPVLKRFIPLFLSMLVPGLGLVLVGRVRRFFCWLAVSAILQAALLWFLHVSATCFAITIMAGTAMDLIMLVDSWRVPSKPSGKALILIILAVIGFGGFFWAADAMFWGSRMAFVRIAGHAMEPTLSSQRGWLRRDLALVDYDAYRDAAPQRGDIVVFSPHRYAVLAHESLACKRVAGLPRESISMQPPCVYVNEIPLTDPLIFATMAQRQRGYSGYALAPTNMGLPVVLGQTSDMYQTSASGFFLLGDDPNYSIDSRYYGEVHRTDILGKVTGIVWPPARVRDLGTE